MDTQKQQAIDRLKQANNILVTVSRNPSVDQLSAAIGISLLLNKLGKHATAVYSGKTPSTIEFLKPENTLEKNTDSLRDFIISLDKSKADKLRYKVEDQMVKIFITPYRTSISDKDLEFSQGDFNVEVVLALGVARQQDLDQAITSHGRILHDATVVGVATHNEEEALGSINWVDPAASSLSEMMTELGIALDDKVLDGQMATALLTGIVAETDRFSNQKTTADTMQASAKLMEAGANQQLVANELATPEALGAKLDESAPAGEGNEQPKEAEASADGSLVIEHTGTEAPAPHESEPPTDASENPDDMELPEPEVDQIHIDYDGQLKLAEEEASGDTASSLNEAPSISGGSRLILQPPTLGGQLTANSEKEGLDPAIDPLAPAKPTPLLHHNDSQNPPKAPKLPSLDAVSSPPAPEPPVEPAPAQPEPVSEPVKPEPAPASQPVSAPIPPVMPPMPPMPPVVPQSSAQAEVATSQPEPAGPPTPPASMPTVPAPKPEPVAPPVPPQNTPTEPVKSDTLADLERFVSSPHAVKAPEGPTPPVEQVGSPEADTTPEPAADPEPPKTEVEDVHAARSAVEEAMSSTKPNLEPVQSLNAMPLDLNLGDIPAVNTSPASAFVDPSATAPPAERAAQANEAPQPQEPPIDPGEPSQNIADMHVASDPGLPPSLITNEPVDNTAASVTNPTAPPPVPPPMMPPGLGKPASDQEGEKPLMPPVL